MDESHRGPGRLSTAFNVPAGLTRSRDDRVCAGVCAGIARYVGVDPVVVRLAVVLLTFANAVGIALYIAAWVILPDQPRTGTDEAAAPALAGARRRGGLTSTVAVGSITLGMLILVKAIAPSFFPDHLVWPATMVALGLSVMWARAGDDERARWKGIAARLPGDPSALFSGRGLWLRLAVGGLLLITGIGWFASTNQAISSLGQIGMAVVASVLGIAVLLGPWIAGLISQLREERVERVRSEERSAMAAHLHDSVLQTLALIQRRAESPQQARNLARRQERELRTWLYEVRDPVEGATLVTAVDQLSDDVEADHDVVVETVVVGDRPLEPGVEALVGALREATVNAAKHSGETEVSVYVEVEDDAIEAFVRDRGCGFDPAGVNGDRRGIAKSIVDRMARAGGHAEVHSDVGAGTEVTFHLPLGGRVRTREIEER